MPADEESLRYVDSIWQAPNGDRMQEIVFIEAGLNRHSIGQSLNAALLTNGEMSLRPEGWKSFDDPLADWEDRAAAATAP